jgi:hypothetical protein
MEIFCFILLWSFGWWIFGYGLSRLMKYCGEDVIMCRIIFILAPMLSIVLLSILIIILINILNKNDFFTDKLEIIFKRIGL